MNKEFLKMQKTAGLITESQYITLIVESEEQEIDQALSSGVNALQDLSSLDEIKEQPIEESVVGLVASGLLAAPKLIEWLGKAIKFISKPFIGKDENTVAKNIIKFGHKWEKLYLKAIIAAIKFTKFGKQLWMLPDNKIDEQKLVTVAKILYGVILSIAAGSALKTVLSSSHPILTAIESALGGVKAVEIAQIASKVKGQI
jgi:hypothetical protein